MKTIYYIIEKNEYLIMSSNPQDMKVYKTDGRGQYTTGYLTETNKAKAIKTAKLCGMDVVIYIGSEKQNDERIFIS